jgi:hypothetical protein
MPVPKPSSQRSVPSAAAEAELNEREAAEREQELESND